MLKRPLVLKLFALLLFIDPLLRLCFITIETEFPFWIVLQKAFALSPKDFFNFWVLFPLSGLLLLSVKIYSYIFFILVQIYSLYFHLNYKPYSWPYLDKNPSTTAYILLTINMLMVIYLLMPRSRELFFDESLRWWERGDRYTINEPCFAKIQDKEYQGVVCDLSFGGALVTFKENINIDKTMDLSFDILGKNITLKTQVVRAMEDLDGKINYGLQFLFKNKWEKFKLKLIMFSISKVSDYEKFR